MRFFIHDGYYESFLKSFYKKNSVSYNNYTQQKNALISECFGTSNFYSTAFKRRGHEAEEFIPNDDKLQLRWAHEHNVNINYIDMWLSNIPKVKAMFGEWKKKILKKQIESYKPDIFFSQGILSDHNFLLWIKKRGIKIVGQIASPLCKEHQFHLYDFVFSANPIIIESLKVLNVPCYELKLAFGKNVLNLLKDDDDVKKHDVVFIGSISPQHVERIALLEYVSKNLRLDIWFDKRGIKKLPVGSALIHHYHGEAWGLDMYEILRSAKIVINCHTDDAQNIAGNMRLYETTGIGSFLLTDDKINLNRIFDKEKEIATYRSKEELVEKVGFYLKNEKKRKSIAKAGQIRTLKEHTYDSRIEEMLAVLKNYNVIS